MKIESSTKPSGSPVASEARSRPSAKATATGNDAVSLSGVAAQLTATDDEQTFNSARVSEIKQAISEGRFTINAGAIADRLISSAKELVASQRQA